MDILTDKYHLMLGDCLERMKEIPDGSIDFILTDPPYGTTACKWDSVIPFEAMWEEIWRVIKCNGAVALFGSEPFSSALRMSSIKQFKYDWVWEKTKAGQFLNAKRRPLESHEKISMFYKKQATYIPQMVVGEAYTKKAKTDGDGGCYGSFSRVGQVNTNTGTRYPRTNIKFSNPNNKTVHPTQKPVPLLEYLIKTYTVEGEIVLDFTMGSGSTGVACCNTERKFVGIEQEGKYFEIANQRIEEGK